MRRIAVIDLGTNTFHLLITEVSEGIKVIPGNICKETIPVKLGEGGINKGIIHPEAYQRGIKAIEQFAELISRNEVAEVKAMATAAIRSARNGPDFIAEIKERTGIEIEMIDGEKEARLIYAGVREAVEMTEKASLIMDIGGGSVEFILCNSSRIFWKKSYPLGAAKLMEQFHRTDPISKEDLGQIRTHLDKTLTELMAESDKYKPEVLIGSAGAFETFAELVKQKFKPAESESNLPAQEIPLSYFNEIAAMLIGSTHRERTEMKGLIPLRVDMIIVATVLTNYIIGKLNISTLMLSDYSLKEGILFDLIA